MAGAAQTMALKVVRNKWFWIAILVIVLVFVWARNLNKIKGQLGKDYGQYTDVTPAEIQPYRKAYLEDLAQRLYTAMTSFWGIERNVVMAEALRIPDGEMKYLANFFKSAITRGESLYYWVDAEWMSQYDEDDQLLARLAKIGEMT